LGLGPVDVELGRTMEGLGLFNILPSIQLFSNKIQSSKFENAKHQLPSIQIFPNLEWLQIIQIEQISFLTQLPNGSRF
jgi:hypothetical protein